MPPGPEDAVWHLAAPGSPPRTYRRTLQPLDPAAFIIPQFWESEGTVWWDLRYLHAFLVTSCWEKKKRHKWYRLNFSKQVIQAGLPLGIPPERVSPFTADTLALVAFLWSSADVSNSARLGGMQNACVAFIRSMIARATTHLRPEHTCMTLEGVQCMVYNGGQMIGFHAVARVHPRVLNLLTVTWESMYAAGILSVPGNTDQHGVQDVATFLMLILSRRRCGLYVDYSHWWPKRTD